MKKFHFLTELNRRKFFALQKGVYGAFFTGQLGKTVVGATIFGKKSLRTYAIPSNPNTVAQQSVRGKFKISQVVASAIKETILWPYWNPFASGQSGFNLFIGSNSVKVSNNQDFLGLVAVEGSYEPIKSLTSAVYTTGTGAVDVVWDGTVENIGNANDRVIFVVLDKTDYNPGVKKPILMAYVSTTGVRDDANAQITIRQGITPANIFIYVGLRQPATDSILKIGTSKSKVCVAP